jgi:nucleotide-binding universal stress UspA family protein
MTTSPAARPVIVAFDGSAEALEAVRAAGALFPDRLVVVVTVWEPALAMETMPPTGGLGEPAYIPPSPEQVALVDDAQRERAQATAAAGARIASEAGATTEAVSVPDAADVADTLVGVAEERDAVALVVGSRGLGRVKSALLGSTTRRLLHATRRPVLVVRAPD